MPLALITGVHPETLSQEKFSHQNYSQFLTWNLVSQFHQLLVLQLLVYIHLNNKQWIFEQELCFKVANNAWMTEWLTTEETMPTTGFFCWETSIFKHKGRYLHFDTDAKDKWQIISVFIFTSNLMLMSISLVSWIISANIVRNISVKTPINGLF